MAEQIPALEQTQRDSQGFLQNIRDELLLLNGINEKSIEDRKTIQEILKANLAAQEEEAARQAEADAEAEKEALAGRSIIAKTNDFLKRMLGNSDWAKENTLRMQKAMKSMLIDKPSAMMKGLADKTGKFATDILKLLLTGGILFGLYKLLEWLSKQNPMELYNMAVAAFDNFNKEYGGFIEGISRLAASVAVWKTAEFLGGAGKGALWALWTSIKTIFGAGGKFFVLAASATGWAGSALFGEN